MQKIRSLARYTARYKVHHLLFWCLYHYMILVIDYGNPIKAFDALLQTPQAIRFLFYVVFQAAAVYLNFYLLIPRILAKGRYVLYGVSVIATVLVSASIITTGYYLGVFLTGRTFESIYGPGTYCLYFFFSHALPSTFTTIGLMMCLKLTRDWIQSKRKQQALEKEKLQTELNFLKNQFNPHFVFNTINSIFFLIHKNPDKASASLAKFSELLRYQLYECNEELIPLSREMTFIENSIELEKLRLNNNVSVDVQIDSSTKSDLLISPFILTSFVENAFKHVSKQVDTNNWIRIEATVKQDLLTMHVANSAAQNDLVTESRQSGIGLKNVQRRLDLLYGDKHQLTIQRQADVFDIELKLKLDAAINRELLGNTFNIKLHYDDQLRDFRG